MLSVFLSYTRSDALAVEHLALDLRGLGCSPWFDTDLAGGADWWTKILSKIRESDVFLFAVSSDSVESPACQAEFTYARQLNRRALPILVAEGVNISLLPRELAILQLVDYRQQDKKAAISLARSLLSLPPPLPLPEALPQDPPPPLSYLGELREHIDAKVLDFDRQSSLLVRMKELVRAGKAGEVLEVAMRFRRRHDVYAIVAEELDEILAKSKSAVSSKTERPIINRQEESRPQVPAPKLATIAPEKLHGRTYAVLAQTYSDAQLMTALGIAFDGSRYQYLNYSFAVLPIAVDYALRRISPKSAPA